MGLFVFYFFSDLPASNTQYQMKIVIYHTHSIQTNSPSTNTQTNNTNMMWCWNIWSIKGFPEKPLFSTYILEKTMNKSETKSHTYYWICCACRSWYIVYVTLYTRWWILKIIFYAITKPLYRSQYSSTNVNTF